MSERKGQSPVAIGNSRVIPAQAGIQGRRVGVFRAQAGIQALRAGVIPADAGIPQL
jgi:hypothetical protein